MQLSARSDIQGTPVDWWFAYKLPKAVGPGRDSTGDEFLYCDSTWNSELHLSKSRLNRSDNPVAATLKQIFSENSDAGYVLWNDEIPPTRTKPKPSNNQLKGHTKGILGFHQASNSGFYLLHSTPRFPVEGEIELPDDERDFGQTFLCITLNFSTITQIAEIVRTHHEAQVYGFRHLPKDEHSPLVKLTRHDHTAPHDSKALFADFQFRSRARNEFRLFAKNKRWSEPSIHASQGKDFWNHLVSPALRDNIDVETWRRGEVFGNITPGCNTVTLDVLGINLEALGYHGYEWSFTKDHAKWGSTEHQPAGFFLRHPGFVVIADINRDESQAKRGGGGIAFQHDGIWRALKSVKKVESTIHRSAHHAH